MSDASSPGMSRLLRLALIQLRVGAEKSENLANAVKHISKAAADGAAIVCLPECFNSPYGTQFFDQYAENIPGETSSVLAQAARNSGVWLFGGSIPERRDGRLFNTSLVFSPTGDLVARYSKVHLFDIDVPGKITFKESSVLSPGAELVTVDAAGIRVGLGICYDARFAEMAQVYAQRKGCHLLLYPGAFNMTTGPAHWQLLARARAVDNQVFVAFCSPSRDPSGSYVAWGHSLIVDPWGEVIASAEADEAIVQAEISVDRQDEVRRQIPVTMQKRTDVYEPPRSLK